jgi:hypothetical protein
MPMTTEERLQRLESMVAGLTELAELQARRIEHLEEELHAEITERAVESLTRR